MSCRRLVALLFAVAICSAIVPQTFSQNPDQPRRPGGPGGFGFGGPGGPGGGIDLFGLVAAEQVQKELEIVDDQKEQLKKLGEELRESMRAAFQSAGDFRNLADDERQKKFAEMREKTEGQRKEFAKKMGDILLPHQMDRLQQISIQLRGAGALADPAVSEKLGLNDTQKQDLAKIQDDNRQAMQKMFEEARGNEGNREGMREKMEQARREVGEKSLAVLTADQKAQFEKMQGEKIEIDRSQLFQGRPGGPGRPGGNNDKNKNAN